MEKIIGILKHAGKFRKELKTTRWPSFLNRSGRRISHGSLNGIFLSEIHHTACSFIILSCNYVGICQLNAIPFWNVALGSLVIWLFLSKISSLYKYLSYHRPITIINEFWCHLVFQLKTLLVGKADRIQIDVLCQNSSWGVVKVNKCCLIITCRKNSRLGFISSYLF